jgi:hypothetical protein
MWVVFLIILKGSKEKWKPREEKNEIVFGFSFYETSGEKKKLYSLVWVVFVTKRSLGRWVLPSSG